MNDDWKAEDFERPPLSDELRAIGDQYVQEKVRQNPNANIGQALQWIEEAQLLIYRKQLEGEHRVLEVQKRNTQ